ncbi:MAG: hypothetical protein IT204_24685 [Fimbriimonadaceae bacterium]|nr:hypothetical protein [Fimbriimonadaceae bacterium]
MLWSAALAGLLLAAPPQYLVLNTAAPPTAQLFDQVRAGCGTGSPARRIGVAAIFSYLHHPRERVLADLREFLRLAAVTDTPVVVQLDGENWWGGRPDLWNWWDPAQPGYDPANRQNVEWTGWGPQHAIQIAWRNWGRQIRVLPPPNLLSPRYRAACHAELAVLVPEILSWWRQLPAQQQDLLIGIKVGWESSLGVNAWYYPDGNALLARPAADDPQTGLRPAEPPSRGVVTIGYAAASTGGLRLSGELTEADQAAVVRRHLADLCAVHARLGVPRDRLFTHVAGWREGELLYAAGLNPHACPGWSFYRYASDPRRDAGVQQALTQSDAPAWAAVEWWLGSRDQAAWSAALAVTLADPRCRYLAVYNWQSICDQPAVLQAIRDACRPAAGPPP